jgi:outer membrane protein OmpU
MKKVLLATTAVVLSVGVASAEVSLSGNARMGLQYDSASGNTRLEKRMTVNIDGSTETTSGITFGARLRLRSNEAANMDAAGARVYMKTGAIEVAVGNINGAIESMPGLYDPSVGLTGLGWGGLVTNTAAAGYWGWDSYTSSSNGVEGIEMIYSGGAFTGHLSYSEQTLSSGAAAEERIGLMGAYTMNDWTFALALQDSDNNANDKIVLTVGGKLGDYGVGFSIADNDGVQKIALNGSATFGATTVNAYIAKEDTAGLDMAYGIGASYDLGGASLVGGISHSEVGVDRADIGVSFSF